MNKSGLYFFLFVLSISIPSCITQKVTRTKDIVYSKAHNQKLDVYSPENAVPDKKPVMLFIHGGNWRSGDKSLYKFFGKTMAINGIVCVVMDYRLSDEQNYAGMGKEITESVKWVQEHISEYGGDPTRIFLSGHSSGGHLAALLALDNTFYEAEGFQNPVKGAILIDAFGLDMHHYLSTSLTPKDTMYYKPFTRDEDVWKKASPINYLKKTSVPLLMFVGGRTFPAIKHDSQLFYNQLKKFQPSAKLEIVKRKKHIPMIFMFGNSKNKNYKLVLDFVNR